MFKSKLFNNSAASGRDCFLNLFRLRGKPARTAPLGEHCIAPLWTPQRPCLRCKQRRFLTLKIMALVALVASSTFTVMPTYACSAVDFQGCVNQILTPLDAIQKTLETNGTLYQLLQSKLTSTNSKLDTSNTSLTAIKGLLTFSKEKSSALNQIYDQLDQIYLTLATIPAPDTLTSSTAYYKDYLDDTAGATKPQGNPYLLGTDLETPIATGIEVQAMSARNQLAEKLYNYMTYGQFTGSQSIKPTIFAPSNKTDLTSNYLNLISAESPVYGPFNDTSKVKSATPPASAKDLLGTQIYAHGNGKKLTSIDPELDNRLQTYIKNLSASGFALPAMNVTDPEPAQAEYIVLQRTLSAIQSLADYNIAEAYAERLPAEAKDSPNPSSAISLLQFMDTHNPGSQAFWDSFFEKDTTNLFTRIHMMLVSFFGINYNLYKISQELEQIKLELAGIMTQNTITLSINSAKPMATSVPPNIKKVTPTAPEDPDE